MMNRIWKFCSGRSSEKIRQQEIQLIFASNGVEALEKLHLNPDVDIILTDIYMPEMDGLTLLTKLREIDPIIKAIIISAFGDLENIRAAMNRGALIFSPNQLTLKT